MKRLKNFLFLLAAAPVVAFAAGPSVHLDKAPVNLTDKESLQRGARVFVNYCLNCHSASVMRYSRLEDLGLTEEQITGNLMFAADKPGETMKSGMTKTDGKAWFGATPPDLSVISRSRGADWIYTYLKSFYLDESRPVGWNNKLFPNASMPNPLWELQGLQQPVYGKKGATGELPVEGFTISQPGTQDAAAFDQTARDITAFLEYAGEPAAIKRQSLGVWVILFLAFFTLMAWLLKTEYWRDVH